MKSVFIVIEKWSYDLKQLAPLEFKIVSVHDNHAAALETAMNTHPWDMNYTDWRIEIEKHDLT